MFIERKDGAITGSWTCRQFDGQEEVPDDDAELVAFMSRPLAIRKDPAELLREELEAKGVLTKEAR